MDRAVERKRLLVRRQRLGVAAQSVLDVADIAQLRALADRVPDCAIDV